MSPRTILLVTLLFFFQGALQEANAQQGSTSPQESTPQGPASQEPPSQEEDSLEASGRPILNGSTSDPSTSDPSITESEPPPETASIATTPSPTAERPRREPVEVPMGEMWTDVLPNGLRVAGRTQGGDLAAICVSYRVGSQDDPPGYTGLAHLTEHLMFEPTTGAPNGFFGLLEPTGATYINAYTKPKETQYCTSLPDVSLERALFGESQRMAFLLQSLGPAQVATQRRVVANESLERDRGDAMTTLSRLHIDELHRNDPVQLRGFREQEDVEALRLEHIQWFHQTYYGPANAAVAVVSPRPQAEIRALIHRYFDRVRGRPAPTREAETGPALEGPVEIDFVSRLRDATIRVVWPTPPLRTEDDLALDFVAAHLRRLLRDDLYSGLTLAIGARQFSDYAGSYFQVEFRVRRRLDLNFLLRRIDAHIRTLATTELDEEQRRTARGSFGFHGNAPRTWAASMAHTMLFEGRIWTREAYDALYDRITPAQIQQAARRWLLTNRRLIIRTIFDYDAPDGGQVSIRRAQ